MPEPFVLVSPGVLDGLGAGDRVPLPDGRAHHLSRVLRLRDGAPVVVADGAGTTGRGVLDGKMVELSGTPVEVEAAVPRVTVWQALGKARKHDEAVRVLSELGVDEIVAVTSERSVVDLDGKHDKARARWAAVAEAACEQARRPRLPVLSGPSPVAALLHGLDGRPCLVAHPVGGTDPVKAVAEDTGPAVDVVVAVGPEGGWSDDEVTAFAHAGAVTVTLGPTVLRTEHAATVLVAILLAATGRMTPRGG